MYGLKIPYQTEKRVLFKILDHKKNMKKKRKRGKKTVTAK
jgi:hypothetical protein